MGKKKPARGGGDDENPPPVTKSKKKGVVIDDDEYSIPVELSDDSSSVKTNQDDEPQAFPGKKGKKATAKSQPKDDDEQDKKPDVGDDEESVPIVFAGKKKPKSKKNTNQSLFSALDALDIGDDAGEEKKEESEEEPMISFSGKKKSSKSSKKSSNLFSTSGSDFLDNEDVEERQEDDEVSAISFSGKKKSSKSSKKMPNFDEDKSGSMNEDNTNEDDDDSIAISFTGKKKSAKNSKKNSNSSLFATSVPEEDYGVDEPKKPSNDVVENEVGSKATKDETSKKQKKNKKKSGRTAQEEDDLDKILAELGEALPIPKATTPTPEEVVQPQTVVVGNNVTMEEKEVEGEGEGEAGGTAAAKKKKKKKEKEKEKKAAAAAAAAVEVKEEKVEEVKTKVSDKKIPKHVREMQEALARRKEADERKKKEEEEKLRKEEEERKRVEELERLAEEAKRRKKEKEKEKLLKKKQEGRLLTGKQKEEARRLEAMRIQFLAQQGGVLPTSDTVVKKPKYERKKTKPSPGHANGGTNSKVEEMTETESQAESVPESVPDSVPESEQSVEVEKGEEDIVEEEAMEKVDKVEENGVDDEDEEDEVDWDAKSWDDAGVVVLPAKSAFDEEEEEEEPVVKKVGFTKRVTPPVSADSLAFPSVKATEAPMKAAPAGSQKSQVVENKGKEIEVEASERQEKRKGDAKNRETRATEAQSKKSADNLRSPICCILGHVDTGKTKLLDCIRGTNVQEGEAGGITQQIGATYFPAENIRERTRELKENAKLQVPGLLVIDTPGHESFTNLRSRGSGLCDIAILVVDIMHGLEPQTIESLNLLKMRNTEFIVALNKVDRLYGWKVCPNAPIGTSLKAQSPDVLSEFKMRVSQIITQFMEQGLNTELYYKNKEMGQTFSIVPTSAVTGEGLPDLLLLLVQWTQKTMVEKLMFSTEIQCTVLEVKVIEGLGTTIDVVLVNGVLHEGDQIVVCGMQGPIVTTIRALLTPHPMKELRVKGTYVHHKELKAAQGVKITAQGLEHAIAGTGLYVVGPDDDLEDVKDAAMQDMKSIMSRIDKSGEGVCVQASTLGSLEALLEFLKSPAVKIPVSGISIGPVHKKDVMRASVMLERKKEYATILAFDVKVTPEARELADETGVKIFCADIIYHLFDQFKAYIDNLKEEKKKEAAEEAVFPCVLQIMPNCVFNKKDPIVLGVDVLEGLAKVGTPICIPSKEFIDIGRISSIEINHKQVDVAKKGQKVAIKIVGSNSEEQQKMFGRHFEMDDELVSHISRKSIDILKANYREDLSIEEWKLVVKLKTLFKIQ